MSRVSDGMGKCKISISEWLVRRILRQMKSPIQPPEVRTLISLIRSLGKSSELLASEPDPIKGNFPPLWD
jgi:hypothetical protein